jgi:hypothetical protein
MCMLYMLYADVLTGTYMLYTISSKAVYTYSTAAHALSGTTNLYIYIYACLFVDCV